MAALLKRLYIIMQASVKNMKKVLCLLYHRVNIINDAIFNLTVSPEHFKEQMHYISSNYEVLKFDDDWKQGEGNAIVVTFDDGYSDNYKYALPILEKEHVPATIFVSTGYVDSKNEYWWDELSGVLTMNIEYPSEFTLNHKLYAYSWETDTIEKRIELIKDLHWLLRMEPDYNIVFEWIEQLKAWTGISYSARMENLPINLEQLKSLADSKYITIGAHTVNHVSLGCLSKKNQEYEIEESIKYISKYSKNNIKRIFSFPFGSAADYNHDTVEICKKNKIIKSATTNKKIWTPEDSPYEIPRISIEDCNLNEFIKCISEYLEV